MSAAFAPSPSYRPRAEADEPPHHQEQLPPPSTQLQPQQLPDGPFAHQLNPPTTAYASSPPQNRQQHSSGGMASTNGNGNGNGHGHGNGSSNPSGQPMPVPGGRVNGHGNGAHLREMGFAGPRSPPNNKSRLWHWRACP
jgi:hypothetical protein